MDLVFAAETPWVWDAEKNFARLKAENPDLVLGASRGNSIVDPERGVKIDETHEAASHQEVPKMN